MGEQWGQILWLDEPKVNLRGSDGKQNVRRPVGKRLKPMYTVGTMKHEGDKGLMVWVCFSGFSALGTLYRIEGITDKYTYIIQFWRINLF